MKQIRVGLTAVLLMMCAAAVFAEKSEGRVGIDGVYIVNYSDAEIKFQLSSDGTNWFTYTLAANYFSTYAFDEQTYGYIRISTAGSKTVQYKLNTQSKYQILWNDETSCWDVFVL